MFAHVAELAFGTRLTRAFSVERVPACRALDPILHPREYALVPRWAVVGSLLAGRRHHAIPPVIAIGDNLGDFGGGYRCVITPL